jgi:hypothetical protein
MALVALTTICAIVTGCGGSSPKPVSTPSQHAYQTPRQSNPDRTQAGAKRVDVSSVHRSRRVQHGRTTYSTSRDDEHASAKTFNPCQLVSLSEARAISGGSVTSQSEAPLGPTCVYRRAAPQSEITVAVEAMSLPQAVHGTGSPQPVRVGGQHGYCVRTGAQALFVPLTAGRLLHITAPCAIAQGFAVRALPRLGA